MESETLSLLNIPWLRRSDDGQGFSGHIEQWPLWDVLMWLHLSHRTAKVDVAGEEGRATVAVINGQIQGCECGGMCGVAALDCLIHWDRGSFAVREADGMEEDRNITVGTEQLLFGVLRAGGTEPPANGR